MFEGRFVVQGGRCCNHFLKKVPADMSKYELRRVLLLARYSVFVINVSLDPERASSIRTDEESVSLGSTAFHSKINGSRLHVHGSIAKSLMNTQFSSFALYFRDQKFFEEKNY